MRLQLAAGQRSSMPTAKGVHAPGSTVQSADTVTALTNASNGRFLADPVLACPAVSYNRNGGHRPGSREQCSVVLAELFYLTSKNSVLTNSEYF